MTAEQSAAAAEPAALGPVKAHERVEELDVLRGMALYGVFLANMLALAGPGLMGTDAQLLSLPSAPLDFTLRELVAWLVGDKANTLFAFLFGLGFYLQMQRAGARGADFDRLYLRRLTVLLAFGIIHTLFFWVYDILNLYALAGFALFALRRVSNRTLLVAGVLLALFGRTAYEALMEFAGLENWHGLPTVYGEAVVLERQALSQAGDYWGLFANLARFTLVDWLLEGLIVGWLLYALGRFMLGAWVGRRGWLQDAARYLPGFRRVLRVALPLGLIAEGLAQILFLYDRLLRLPDWDHWRLVAEAVHLLAVPVLAAGYLCAIVVGLHSPAARRWLTPFAYAGRMALSNYVGQSLIFGFVVFGVGPGLALAGRIGYGAIIVIVTVAYAAQILVSRWWLGQFRYGPLEWLWRGLTYGRWPQLRRAAAASAVG